ncbi:hypothetical protein BDV93DRAFT_467041 [Ceratobasidium sp. AG-I]|nr:hypothetical protein BDV93DRAFT_467041 [Ceratobasidium sp. AG-I]
MASCNRCNRYFGSYDALSRHERDSQRHNICHECNIDYWSFEDLHEHLVEDPRHNYCVHCQEDFHRPSELNRHNERDHEYCQPCDMWLDTANDMVEHDKEIHNLCVECNRCFSSINALKNHLNSSKHLPKTVVCPGRQCEQKFISKAALLLHLEGGRCSSGATRHTINRFVAERDTNHFITNPNRMITGPTQTWATQRAWNGHSFECYLCRRDFQTLASLNQHLASPAHDQPVYRCPPHLNNGCQMQFKLLSALCQHIESGSCGVLRFRVVRDTMDGLVQGMNRLGYR